MELNRVLEIMSHYDSADENGKHHITEEIFGFLDYLAGPLIEKQLCKEGRRPYLTKAFHLNETERPNEWPTTDEDCRSYRARVLIALLGFMRVPLKNIKFPVSGISRDLLALTCDHKYSPKYLPLYQRGRGKDDGDDRRIIARRKFTLSVFAEVGSTGKSITSVLEEYRAKGIPITEGTWKNLREEIPFIIRNIVEENGDDDFDYSGYDLPDSLQDLFSIAVQLK